ncbi:MAG TPA: acyl-CoA carboxylase epsilon subunit [Trebonia sp.]|nr:acyl-CoA carboxylase epsilon subunit [Trebonia sp.]
MASQGQSQTQDTAERRRLPLAGTPFPQLARGDATAEEIAALVAALMAVAATRSRQAGDAKPAPVRPAWNAPERLMRAPAHPSPGGWRRSALP